MDRGAGAGVRVGVGTRQQHREHSDKRDSWSAGFTEQRESEPGSRHSRAVRRNQKPQAELKHLEHLA